MRISFLVSSDHASGGMRAIHEYSRHLAARGHTVQISITRHGVVSGRTGRPLNGLQRMERQVKRCLKVRQCLPMAARFGLRVAARHAVRLLRLRSEHRSASGQPYGNARFVPDFDAAHLPEADALVVYDWASALRAAPLPARFGRKFYLVQAEEVQLGAPAELAARAFRLPYCKVVVSSWLKRMMADNYGEEAKGPVINGVDFDQFHDAGGDEKRSQRVGMMYASAPYKGSRDGIRAIELARRECPDIELLVFGRDAPSFPLPAPTRFYYDPPQEMLRNLYSSCGIWISPSLVEGSPMPVQEAMACGCAVVTTNVGGVQDWARPGVNVVVVAPGDVNAMAAEVVALHRDQERRRAIAAAASADIRQFTWERAAEQFEQILSGTGCSASGTDDRGAAARGMLSEQPSSH